MGVQTNCLCLLPALLFLAIVVAIQFKFNSLPISECQFGGIHGRQRDISSIDASRTILALLVSNNDGTEKLILGPVPHLTPAKILQILDTQDLSGLKELVIEDDFSFEISMLTLFLSKHPGIERLYLGRRSLSKSSNPTDMDVPDGLFDHLKSLSGSAPCISTLLLYSQLFSSLDSIFIDTTSSVSSGLPSRIASASFPDLDEALQSIACVYPQPSHLGLILAIRPIQHRLSRKDLEGSVECSLGGVLRLTLGTKPGAVFGMDVLGTLARWIELFPSVTQVSFIEGSLTGHDAVQFCDIMRDRCYDRISVILE
ncbi:hypothetical protein C8J56DRAFT_1062070 [Mycena floridula]|nr:hypothetical protein C8J56DRAFT_1062070 [Mycena floridula]